MVDKTGLQHFLHEFSGLSEEDFRLAESYWYPRKTSKGDFFNTQGVVCKELGFITKGMFRVYRYDPETEEQKNVYFFSENQFLVSFHSFIRQYPCAYYFEALEDAHYLAIRYDHLQELYQQSAGWNTLGRKLAEKSFEVSQLRMESLLFLSHEQRYISLINEHPDIANRIPLYHISSYLGIKNPSLSRIRKRLGL